MPTFERSLSQAHRLMQRLREASQAGQTAERSMRLMHMRRSGSGVITTGVPASARERPDAIRERLLEKAETMRSRIDRSIRLDRDYRAVKEAVFSANQETGVSELLSRQAATKNELSAVQRIIRAIESAPASAVPHGELDNEAIASVAENAHEADESEGELYYIAYDLDELEERRTDLRRELNRLDDEIRQTNAETTVEFTISETGAEELGLV